MNTVYVVHCVDTEGPLHESIEDTFARIHEMHGVTGIAPTRENLRRLQARQIPVGGKEDAIARDFSIELLRFNDDWSKIDAMLERIMSRAFRSQYADSRGGGWVFSWHCMDHLDYESNPRRKVVGIHAVFDHYVAMIRETGSSDSIHWHFHPQAIYREGHRNATSYINSPNLHKIIARRMIERGWFPTVNRPGYHSERPDSHAFLEQWIPFDYANQSMPSEDLREDLNGLTSGRYGDWRGAPSDWSVYHPSHRCYQVPGNCLRKIARCLNIGTRHHLLDQKEVNAAFQRAATVGDTILAFSDHDYRDMTGDVTAVYEMLLRAKDRFPSVSFVHADAREAMRQATFTPAELTAERRLALNLQLHGNILEVRVTEGEVFGPQPFLALKTRDQRFLHDNLDVVDLGRRWSYVFDAHTVPLVAIERIAVASNDKYGNACVAQLVN